MWWIIAAVCYAAILPLWRMRIAPGVREGFRRGFVQATGREPGPDERLQCEAAVWGTALLWPFGLPAELLRLVRK